MFKNLFNKNNNTQTYNAQPSHLLVEPVFTNVAQMNNEFLQHHKPLSWQNSQGLWQTTQPLQTLPLQQQQQQPYWRSRGLNRGPYRQIRLRTHNWGTRSENGWSGFNGSHYQSQNLSSWEPQSYLLSELRAQSLGQRGLAAPYNQDLFWNQWQQQRFSQQGFGSQQGLGYQQRGFNGLNSGFNNNGLNSGFGNNGLNSGFGNNGLNSGFNNNGFNNNGFNNNGLNSGFGNNGLNNGFGNNGFNSGFGNIVQTIMRPAIVQETVRTDRVVQVQPILHRAVEQNVINHIEKHITEAPAAPMGGIVRMAPVIQETTQTRVIEEIQPVVHRQVAIAQVERVEEHLAEHIVAPTQHTNRVVYESFGQNAAPIAPVATPLAAPITPINSAQIAPINSAPLVNSAPIAPIQSAPLTNTVNITKVVPTGVAGSPMLLEKQQQAALAQPITPTYGSAMM